MQNTVHLDRAALLREAASNTWWHTIDFGGGNESVGKKSRPLIAAEANAIFDPITLADCSVLDVGAWDGFFSFEAKKRGASRVLATDSYIWSTHPHARRNFEIARQLIGIDVEDKLIDVTNLSVEAIGEFDYVLLLGVFYHLLDPIGAIQSLSRIAKRGLIIETQMALNFLPWPAMRFYPNALLGDSTNWWLPNRACVTTLLQNAGFDKVDFRYHPKSRRRNRGFFHAYKSV